MIAWEDFREASRRFGLPKLFDLLDPAGRLSEVGRGCDHPL